MTNRSVEIISERPLSSILAEHLAGIVLSLLPERWRGWWDSVPSDAVLSGAIEAGVASVFFLRVFLAAMDAEINGIGMRGMTAIAATHGDAGVMSLGPVLLIGLLLKPLPLALAITAIDGYIRAATALISKEVYATIWLAAPERIVRAANTWLNPPKKIPIRIFKDES
jgi:hypothetical protein